MRLGLPDVCVQMAACVFALHYLSVFQYFFAAFYVEGVSYESQVRSAASHMMVILCSKSEWLGVYACT
jgi:hypothetical protein